MIPGKLYRFEGVEGQPLYQEPECKNSLTRVPIGAIVLHLKSLPNKIVVKVIYQDLVGYVYVGMVQYEDIWFKEAVE